jgi:hypothetical protein
MGHSSHTPLKPINVYAQALRMRHDWRRYLLQHLGTI